ncbi:ABC transporter permease [Candidatus Woesearchaeota archaeon]|nr:ABC transporter permease [Candidatus Woesearchaeota archaeon]
MKIKKSLQLALNILVHSKLRSWLTIIGIIIGIAAIVSIVSISEGAQQQMEERFGELGADIITVSPGFSRAMGFMRMREGGSSSSSSVQKNLTSKDVLVLKTIPHIKTVMGTVSARGELKYLGKSGEQSITGVDTLVWKDLVTDALESGRYLTKSDTYSVVVGYDIANTFFDKTVQINRQISIEDRIFKVVGIFKEGENDRAVIIPIDVARDILEDVGDKKLNSITVKVEDVELVDETIENIEKKLMMSRGILREDKKDFSVSSVKELQETISETLRTMAIFLGAIAAISLVVGGIGISNTMFTSVLEKTKEIGVMKAIGARNRDILFVFLLNSGMIGFVGGVGGVILGSVASGAISGLAGGAGGNGMMRVFGATALTPELLIFAFAFSIIVGMVAGAIPAYSASRLKPVDALRYE